MLWRFSDTNPNPKPDADANADTRADPNTDANANRLLIQQRYAKSAAANGKRCSFDGGIVLE